LNSRWRFLAEAVRCPFTTGAFWPSSRALSQAVVDKCEISPGDIVVELGPGTGAFTELILQRLSGHSRFLAVEINRAHAAFLRRRFPRCEVIHDSAENLQNHLHGRQAACIVSGLPWGNMFVQKQNRVLKAILDSLVPGGQFVAFTYAHAVYFPTSRRFHAHLARHFERMESTPIVWRNVPPALVFRCWKRDAVSKSKLSPKKIFADYSRCDGLDACEVR
jgi:phosphatidylethanolamine/phosphatidyl-N-methylethanolamine N-methyltransferase